MPEVNSFIFEIRHAQCCKQKRQSKFNNRKEYSVDPDEPSRLDIYCLQGITFWFTELKGSKVTERLGFALK